MKTLNEMLGMTYHMSPLRMKMLRLGLPDPKQWQTRKLFVFLPNYFLGM
jgi:hypothetical protein